MYASSLNASEMEIVILVIYILAWIGKLPTKAESVTSMDGVSFNQL